MLNLDWSRPAWRAPSVSPVRPIDGVHHEQEDPSVRTVTAAAIVGALAVILGNAAAQSATTALIKGTAQGEVIQGTPRGDVIYGFGGNDEIAGRGGLDVVFGGPGDDTLSGGRGEDYLSGEEGDDTLSAGYVEGRSVDFLSCGAGDDLVILTGVPEVACGGARRLLNGAPRDCESVRFAE